MTEPWFDPTYYAWIPGTLLGAVGGSIVGVMGSLAYQGKAKNLAFGSVFVFLGIAIVMLALGVFALATGQPYGIWYGFGFPGLLCAVMFGLCIPVLRHRYRMAEERRMKNQDF